MTLLICPLTDLPRLLCGCPEHANGCSGLTQAEVDYLDGRAGVAPQKPAQRLSVVPLAEYQSQQRWVEPRDVKVTDSPNLCKVPDCTKPAGDNFVCNHCLDDLEVCLGDVPGLIDDLVVSMTREARQSVDTNQRKRASHTRWDDSLATDASGVEAGRLLANAGYNRVPYSAQAGNAWRTLENEVLTAVRVLTEPLGIVLPVMEARSGSRWLLTHMASVQLSPAGPDIVVGLRRIHRVAQRVIDNDDEGVYLGLCSKCRQEMRAKPEDVDHLCLTCGERYMVAERREGIREQIMGALQSLSEIADLSANSDHFGMKISRKQLEGWVRRGRLVKAGSYPGGPQGEVALYRAGDVLALVEERKAS